MDLIFNLANVFVLPFWVLMIFLPKWGITQKIMESYLPFIILAIVYIYFFSLNLDPESVEALSNPTLTSLAQAFSSETVIAAGWTHYLVMDLFVGRWIYWEGQKTGTWTFHSLTLCLFAGPIGLLSHFITQGIQERFFSITEEESTINPA
ncbi:MAG: ABA4-like family protein [Microcystaceae cyanobacterium]